MGRAQQKPRSTENTRRCIATGQDRVRAEMIRFVLSPDGVVTPDLAAKLPGRGIWVSPDRKALQQAIKKNGFSRSAKTQAQVPEGLLEQVESILTKRLIDLISMARKSGDAICGFDKTKGALISERAAVLLQASDGSDPQKRKLRPPTGQNSYISCLKGTELGLAFGREHVIHAALAHGGLTNSIKTDAARLAAVRGEHA